MVLVFLLSDLLHSVLQTLGLSVSLHMTVFIPLSDLSDIPLCIYTTSSLSVHLSLGI